MTLSGKDIARIVAIIAGLGGSEVVGLITPILKDFYVPSDLATHIVSGVLGIIGVAGLVNLIIARAVPAGMNTVLSPSVTPQPETLTTKTEVVAASKGTP